MGDVRRHWLHPEVLPIGPVPLPGPPAKPRPPITAAPAGANDVTLVYAAALEMNPIDAEDRVDDLKKKHGIGYCNITKCCTKVCPEHITITDNAIIPLKERVVDEFFDPIGKLVKIYSRRKQK